jgi:hypothetical protein
MPRDRAFEREWLERAARDPEFAPRVAERLERAAAELGEDSFRERTLRELCGEIGEEGLDVAGWGVLAQQLHFDVDAPPYKVRRVLELIDMAAELGAHIDLIMRTAMSYLPAPPT